MLVRYGLYCNNIRLYYGDVCKGYIGILCENMCL